MKLQKVTTFLTRINNYGIVITYNNNELIVNYPEGIEVNQSIINEIKKNKHSLVSYFEKENINKLDNFFISPINRSEHIPLSFAQERLWFIDKLQGSVQYHQPVILRLQGRLDKDILESSFIGLVSRHEILRTVIKEEDGVGYQYIEDEASWSMDYIGDYEFTSEENLQLHLDELISIPYVLSEESILRVHLIRLSGEEHILLVMTHHIGSDGWSLSVMIDEFVELYNALEAGREISLAALPIQYADYSLWQRDYLSGELLEDKLKYWEDILGGVAPLELSTDYVRPAIQSTQGASRGIELEGSLLSDLQVLCRDHDVTMFMLLLSVFKVLLYRYSGQVDICVGSPIAGRTQKELEGLIGFFINTLALRSRFNGDIVFTDLLEEVKQTTLGAYEHQDVPFEKIVDHLGVERDMSRSALFQVMFVLQNTPESKEGLSMGDITIAEEGSSNTTSLFDLTLSVTEYSEGLSIGVEYCTDLFMESTIAGMLIHYKELLLSVIQAPGVRVGDLDMLTNEECHELLEVFNDTAVEYPRDKSVVDLFEEQVLQSPDSIALVYEDSILSYQELNKRSNQLGHYLVEEGVRANSLVGICLDRSLDMVIGILGILKSGGAYVPIDPEYPEDRISYMVADTGIELILSDGSRVERLKAQNGLSVADLEGFEYGVYSGLNLDLSISSDSLVYVIYTSGSTGIPKGVLTRHISIVNLISSRQNSFALTSEDRILQFSTYSFDASIEQIFLALFSGLPLILLNKDTLLDSSRLSDFFCREKITHLDTVPSYLNQLSITQFAFYGTLRRIISGGEDCSLSLAKDWSSIADFYNAYGPTESTVTSIEYKYSKLNIDSIRLPIGTPISNTQVYVLDSDGSIQPIGVIGELYVGGLGLSRGYLNRVELTTEKFIASPFKQGDRLYKTGDLCRWNREGNLEFMGRIDDQVKIRGYRIELGEIESVLQELPDVNQGVVLARDDDKGVKRLVGYVVVEGDFDKANLKSQLGDRLPSYMVPEIWVELEKLPLTSNGKVDRKGLPSVDLNNLSSKAYVAPRNEIEENLVAIWSSVLGLERVGIHDNFFELGGDSIITIQVVSRAKRLGYELRPRDLFTYPSIASLSDRVTRESSILGDQGILEGSSGLLPIQQWYFDHSPKDISHYNQSVLLGISKDLLVSDLSQVVEGLVSHHDALRFVYNHVDGSWNQHYGFAAGVLEVEDLCLVSSEDLWDSIEDVCNSYQVSLDIESGIVCRFVLIKTPDFDSHHRLFIVIHHLVVDGVSWRILLDDLELGFSQVVSGGSIDFGFKSSSYREWYDALHTYSLGKSFMSQLGYWRRVLTSYEELPVDYEDSGVEGLGFSDFSISLSESMTYDLLHNVHGAYHTEINDILLSALVLMIKEWTGLSSVVIGLEGHGREDISETIDLSRTVGWFTVLYPVLFSVSQELSLDLVIKSVKEDLRGVPDKGLGYGVLRYLDSSGGIGQDMSSLDSIDLIFNYLGQLDHVLDSGGILTGASESSGLDSSLSNGIENKLAFNGSVTGGVLEFTISYSRDQYAPATIDRLGASYIGHLESIIVHCKSKEISEKTPSDYVGFKGDLSYSSLDSFLSQEVSGGVKQGTLIDSLYGLSPLQSGLLFHGLYGDDSLSYIEQLQVSFYALDVGIFKQSWDYLLKKYSILRTGFHYKDLEEPLQSVYKEVDLPFAELDYRDMSKSERDSVLALFKAEDLKRGFDLAEAPLMRISLMRISNSEHILLWTSHHLILDGWSLSHLMGDFLSTYELLSQGVVLPDIAEDKYEDYIGYIDNVNKYKSESHWENYLSNFSGSSLLPFVAQDLYRNKGEGVYGEEHLVFDSATTTEVQGYCQSNSLTVNSLVQGIWGYLLSRYTGLSDVLYGVTVSGRPDDLKDMETRVGLYINTLPLCVRIKEGQNISSWLQDLQQGHTQGREYQYVPLSDLQKITGVIGDLFDSLLVFENYPVSEVLERGPEGESDSWALSGGDVEMQEQTNYLLTLIVGLDQELSIKFNYNSDILSSAYVSMIKGHFKEVMDQIINSSVDSTLGDLDMLTNEERHELLEVFNDTAVEYPRDKSVVDLFEEQVLQSPDSIALVYEDSILSYGELNSRSNQLGHYLQDKGVKENSLVGICLDRSLDMVIGILGILKSGGGYVPIDPEYPQDRLNYIVDDTELLTLLTSSDYMFNFPSYTGDLLILDFQEEEIAKYKDTNSSIAISSDSLAYIIYTSGSTGIPKGVMVPHAGLQNYLFSSDGLYTITSKEFQGGSYATFSLSFDASITSLFLPLLGGVSLVLSSGVGVSLFEDFNLLSYAPYSFLKLTPSHLSILSSFLDKYSLPFSYLSNVYVFGGESLESHHLSYFDSSNSIYIYNEYGPTESTVGSIVHQIDLSKISKFFSKGSIIGTPISNTQVYVLDSDGSIQPIGVIGELYVGGLGLSRGYLNRLELTTDKFLSNPFKEGDRLYKTGDLCRWSLDGYLEFIGRIDDQVKIRGYRIELGEIESVLVELPDVKQGVVLAREDEKGVKRLVGYLVFDGNSDHASVEDQLAQKLPSYMIPTLWLELEELPLTSNGKVDKKGLPNIGLGSLESNEYVAPRSSIEEVLVAIWQDVLGLNRIGVTDNFFKTGGDSLLAIRVVSMISKELELEISVRDLFEYPMISELSTHLGTLSPGLLVPRLKPQDRPAHIHLSFAQERLWFIDKLEGSVQYHQPVILRLQGRLDKDILESSFIGLVSRHEILRTVIKEEDGVGYQYIEEEASWSMDYIGNYEFTGEEHLQLYLDELISIPYELSEESILRVHLIRLSDEEHILLVMTHHIGSDGWSVSVMIDEFVELYNAFEAGREISLAALPIQYADYSLWQRDYLSGELLEDKLKYWEDTLGGVAPLELSTDYVRPAIQSTQGASRGIELEGSLLSDLQVLCRDHDVTMFMLLLSVFKVLLYRYSGQVDICVGSPIAGRTQKELEGLIGFFINTLALRSRFNGDIVFTDLLEEVKQTTLGAYEHQDVPFEKIVDHLGVERDMSRSALFQVMFVLQNTPESKEGLSMGDITIAEEGSSNTTSLFDLTLSVTEYSEGLSIGVEYCTDLFMESTIAGMLIHYKELLLSVIQAPGVRVGDLDMLTNEECHELLEVFNDTAVEYPRDKSVVDLFEEQVLQSPDSIALVYEDSILSYQELNKRSNQLGHYLVEEGVRANSLVGICLDRSLDMVIGILGILKSGGAYVPIDPEYPEDRISYMVADTGIELILSDGSRVERLKAQNGLSVADLEGFEYGVYSGLNLDLSISSDSLVYVIYTSGSTGIPKGVLTRHISIVNLISSRQNSFALTSEDRILQFSTYSFDASIEQIFLALFSGLPLILLNKDTLLDSSRLSDFFCREKITHLDTVPSYLNQLSITQFAFYGTLRRIISGGEDCSLSLAKDWSSIADFYNAYGPTESTVTSIEYKYSKLNIDSIRLPIGTPISNTQVYVLDSDGSIQPIGVIGELYVGGLGLSRGYLNRVELTTEKFIASPFKQGDRLYKTGDLCRWNREGNLEFMGRIDDQVKIRGYRIELGEIESVLQELPDVNQGVVLARDDDKGVKRLVGYVVVEGDFDKANLKSQLGDRLPSYMVPEIWVELEKLPLTSNGKVDRKGLPSVDLNNLSSKAYVAPRNEIEENLVAIWSSVLGLERVGIHDNFFELGGDSIITIQVVSRAKRLGYELRPRDLFTYPSIASLSDRVTRESSILGDQGILEGSSGLLPIQQWYFDHSPKDISHYNQSVLLGISKDLLVSDLSQVVEGLVSHHDALRFVYNHVDGSWNQHYGFAAGVLEVEDLCLVSSEDLWDSIEDVCNSYQVSLDIESGIVCRFVLIKTPDFDSHHRLFIVIHHLVVDGVSWRILLDDLELGFSQVVSGGSIDFGFKSSSYREWYDTLHTYSLGKSFMSQLGYWRRVLTSYEELPVDYEDSGVEGLGFSDFSISLSESMTYDLLHNVHGAYHTEINDILLSALVLMIKEWTGLSSVVIGLEGHGREDISETIDLSRTVGWFTVLYPVLFSVSQELSLDLVIKSVKEDLRGVPDKGLGYGVLRYLDSSGGIGQDMSSLDSIDLIFNYLGQLDHVLDSGGILTGASESSGLDSSLSNGIENKLAFNGSVTGGVLEFTISYSRDQYAPATIDRLGASYIGHLESIIVHCKSKEISEKTPSDYVGFKGDLSYSSLDSFLSQEVSGGVKQGTLIDSLYGLSPLQSGLLFHGLYGDDSLSYIEQLQVSFYALDVGIFKQSWDYLLKKYSILRTGFHYKDLEEPLQSVYKEVDLPFAELDYRDMSKSERDSVLALFKAEDLKRGFDLAEAPLMRISLMRISNSEHILLWTSHHLILDGWSSSILMGDFLSTYELLSQGVVLPDIAEDKYEDYIGYIDNVNKYKSESHWENYLSNFSGSSLLPFVAQDLYRNKGEGVYGEEHLVFDSATTTEVQGYCQSNSLTVNSLVQGIWGYLLSRYTGLSDVLYGVTVSGRPEDMENVETRVGLYINTLPLRVGIENDQDINSYLQNLQEGHTRSREYQYVPLSDLQKITGVIGDLFDSLLVFENYPVSEVLERGPEGESDSWALSGGDVEMQEQTNYLLTLIVGLDQELSIKFNYNSDILSSAYVSMIKGHFKEVMDQIVNSSVDSTLGDLDMLMREERYELLEVFNDTAVEYPRDKSVIDLFEEQVEACPDAIALVYEDSILTYQELNKRSNQLGHYLQDQGVKEHSLVGICLDRSLDMIIGILGILKSGAGYVPMDPSYPEDRISYMLEDTGVSLVLSSGLVVERLKFQKELLIVDLASFEYAFYSDLDIALTISWDSLAYVIYTSGSTGIPKGVLTRHISIVNLISSRQNSFALTSEDRILQFSTYSFDASVEQIFLALFSGLPLILLNKDTLLDSSRLFDFFCREKITHLDTVPSYLNQLSITQFAFYGTLRRIISGGEDCSLSLAKDWSSIADFYNAYGPTESTVTSIEYKYSKFDIDSVRLPIGTPINNTQIYVLDKGQNLLSKGVIGELYIGGVGLSRGYLNKIELTDDKFIVSPFKQGDRLYKTGDLCRWNREGNLEFIGRIDNQVKIRGYRIELGEIESVLVELPDVKQGVVLAKEDINGNNRLVGYVIVEGDFDKSDLKAQLGDRLPSYMVPEIWVELEKLPLTSNGKVDRQGLPSVDLNNLSSKTYVAPRNDIEANLVAIWSSVLGLERVGIYDNFFELGGHSLLATRAMSLINKNLNLNLSIKSLFDFENLFSLADYIKEYVKMDIHDNNQIEFEEEEFEI